MSRKFLSLAVCGAAFTLILAATEVQARYGWGRCGNQCGFRQSCGYGNCGYRQNCGFGNCGYQQSWGYQQNYGCGNGGCQQTANWGCQQTRYVTVNACCNPQPASYNGQPGGNAAVFPASMPVPQPQPAVERGPVPAPGI